MSTTQPPTPSKCIVHGKFCAKRGQIGDEYHIHYLSPLVGRHFDTIEIQGYGGIRPEHVPGLMDRLFTRLRNQENGIVIKWGGL